jgi:hypothetical protein
MNLNISVADVNASLDRLSENSINNWVRTVDTSSMSVVDRLILDNHRRLLLRNMAQPSSCAATKPPCFSTLQPFDSSVSFAGPCKSQAKKTAFRTLNTSFTSNPDKVPSHCAERLYNDAVMRSLRLRYMQDEKKDREIQNAVEAANVLHPKRKLDQDVMLRLTEDERMIRMLYEKEGADEEPKSQSRRFSVDEQKESVDRLLRPRNSSTCALNKEPRGKKTLMPEELSALIQRLYKVKKREEPQQRKKLVKAKRKITLQQRDVSDLKSSIRYKECFDKSVENLEEERGEGKRVEMVDKTVQMTERERKSEENKEIKRVGLDDRRFSPVNHEEKGFEAEREEEIVERTEENCFRLDFCDDLEERNQNNDGEIMERPSLMQNPLIKDSIEEFSYFANTPIKVEDSFLLISRASQSSFNTSSIAVSPNNPINPCETSINQSINTTDLSLSSLIPVNPSTYFPENLEQNPKESSSVPFFSTFDGVSTDKYSGLSENINELAETAKMSMPETKNSGLEGEKCYHEAGGKSESCLKVLPIPMSLYLEPELPNKTEEKTSYSEEAIYLMKNPLKTLNENPKSPVKKFDAILDSYRFIVGINENDEFIYAD